MKKYLSVTKNIAVTTVLLAAAFGICLVLQRFVDGNTNSISIFILATLLVSVFTGRYIYGIIFSLFSTLAVNYAFTYPYFSLNFSISGYPITFLVLLTVSMLVCTLTIRSKQQAQTAAEIEKEKSRSNLLRAISHDIRTPLTSIMGSSEAFTENYEKLSDSEKKELVKDINEEAAWLIRVVENLLSVTKVSGKEAYIQKNPEAPEEILGEVIMKFKKQFPHITVKSSVPDDLLFVPMDATLIEQVIKNLMENAVFHGGNITEVSVSVEYNSRFAAFSVSDNGCGIREDILPVLFDGTFTPDKEKTGDKKRSMGIGLSVCMSIIKAHGGSMHAYNKPHGGATFEFWLPLDSRKEGE